MKIKGENVFILQLLMPDAGEWRAYDHFEIFKIVLLGAKESVKAVLTGLASKYDYSISHPEKGSCCIKKHDFEKAFFRMWPVEEGYSVGVFSHPNLLQNFILRERNYTKLYNILSQESGIPVSPSWMPELWDFLIKEERLNPILNLGLAASQNDRFYYISTIGSALESFVLKNINNLEKKAAKELESLMAA